MNAIDPKSIAGKIAPPTEHAGVAVVGAGSAGIAAAIAAAQSGAQVVLIDENPVAGALIGLDVPLLWGGRATAAVQRKERMLEQVLGSNPALADAFDSGVDVRLGTYAWGAFANGPNLRGLPGPMLGLADEERAWHLGFDRLVLATGARDLVLPFPSSGLPGVVGAAALRSLVSRYAAFAGRRVAVLGTGQLAREIVALLQANGITIAALVEVREEPGFAVTDVPVFSGVTGIAARGGADGVEALVIRQGAREHIVACDTVCLAVGLVPMVELAAVLGCATRYDPARGGHLIATDETGLTSLPFVSAVGDCAELALSDAAYAGEWARMLLACGGPNLTICQCEEVTRREITGVRPPRYLGGHDRPDPRHVAALAASPHPDHVKRLTRAGMGPCQGRRCREAIAYLLAAETGADPAAIALASYRAPVRPLPLGILGAVEESAEAQAGWDVWFGIPTQWVPYRDIGTEREHVDRYGERYGDNWHL